MRITNLRQATPTAMGKWPWDTMPLNWIHDGSKSQPKQRSPACPSALFQPGFTVKLGYLAANNAFWPNGSIPKRLKVSAETCRTLLRLHVHLCSISGNHGYQSGYKLKRGQLKEAWPADKKIKHYWPHNLTIQVYGTGRKLLEIIPECCLIYRLTTLFIELTACQHSNPL